MTSLLPGGICGPTLRERILFHAGAWGAQTQISAHFEFMQSVLHGFDLSPSYRRALIITHGCLEEV